MQNKKIIWEHFETNYLKKNTDFDEDDDDDFEDFDESEDHEMAGGPNNFMRAFRLPGFMPEVHHTPWGVFHANNPLSPVNMYDISMAHFKGFNVHTIPNFIQLMDSVDGVAVWAQHDPYCIAVGPGKLYSTMEVKLNVEKAIYDALGVTNYNNHDKTLEYTIASTELLKNGTHNVFIRFPNGTSKVYENPSNEELSELLKLKKQINGVIIVHDGKEIQ